MNFARMTKIGVLNIGGRIMERWKIRDGWPSTPAALDDAAQSLPANEAETDFT
jgi:hypothetical protein